MPKRFFSPTAADRLIVALVANDAIAALNQAMRVRKVILTLDYTHRDHLLRVYAELPDRPRETWIYTNTRTKVCSVCAFANPHLQLFANDVKQRLGKLGASLVLVGGKHQRSKPEAKLQLLVEGSERTALTLGRVPPGHYMSFPHFISPDGTIP